MNDREFELRKLELAEKELEIKREELDNLPTQPQPEDIERVRELWNPNVITPDRE